jgi:hypothetical protein
VNRNIAFLELKYGNIYGGYPNFYAISEIAFLVFEIGSKKLFLESWINNVPVDIVNVYSEVNELGHTLSRNKEVFNLNTGQTRPFDENFKLSEDRLSFEFNKLKNAKLHIRNFLEKNFHKYEFDDLVVFDGRRDLFLCERCGADFSGWNVIDLQKELNKTTEYLFSLNKLSVIINYRLDKSHLKSNNLEYWLHPIAARQIVPKSAAWDAARLMMIYNEWNNHHADFLIKAQLLLNKIQTSK